MLLVVASYPMTLAVPQRRLLLVVAVLAAAGAALAVWIRWARAFAWSVAVLALNYGLALAGGETLDTAAPLFAAALVTLLDLGASLIDGSDATAGAPLRRGRSARRTATAVAVTLVAGASALAASTWAGHDGWPVLALIGAGLLVFTLVGIVARSPAALPDLASLAAPDEESP